jgi:hypothetical protein
MRLIKTGLLVVAVTCAVLAGQATKQDLDDPKTLESLLKDFHCEEQKGKRVVFGTLTDKEGQPFYPATVQLQLGAAFTPARSVHDGDAKYCIRYDPVGNPAKK